MALRKGYEKMKQRKTWTPCVFVGCRMNADEITDALVKAGCRGEELRRAKERLWNNKSVFFVNEYERIVVLAI